MLDGCRLLFLIACRQLAKVGNFRKNIGTVLGRRGGTHGFLRERLQTRMYCYLVLGYTVWCTGVKCFSVILLAHTHAYTVASSFSALSGAISVVSTVSGVESSFTPHIIVTKMPGQVPRI